MPPLKPATHLPVTLPALAGVLLLATACSTAQSTQPAQSASADASSSASSSASQGGPASAPASSSSAGASGTASTFALRTNVTDGATRVPVSTLLTVTPSGGRVTGVTVSSTATGKNAATITGSVDGKGVWTANTRLDPDARYTVTASGNADDGTPKTRTTTFTTMGLSRSDEVFPTLSPTVNGPYGVATPVVVQFDVAVKNKAEFERNMHVTSVPAQQGSWGWLDDRTAHFRPKDYWKPGTTVHLDANLNGVDAGNGHYGQLNRELDLKIGRQQIGRVDIAKHTVSWQVGDAAPKTYPMTAGKPGFTTRSGTKVVMEKAQNIEMASETTGIARDSAEGYNVHVAYALRVTNSGEFIHSAPWNAGNFGVRNASHGCVGMSTDAMYSLFTTAQIGDPVVFTGSSRTLENGNGWTDWNVSWAQWQAKSALH